MSVVEIGTPLRGSVVEHDASTVEVAKPATVTTRRDVLHRAADLLEEFGWTQGCKGMPGDSAHHGDAFCLLGAIYRAQIDFGLATLWDIAGDYPGAAKTLSSGAEPSEFWRWNDDPVRTKAEVVALLREAAEAA